ncbi:MAG TPA: hypothetical protein VEB40_11725, partial [Flavipsychrobacter sp.]|nr:hypothetical protein [Flavipsychrobacter sp.]
MTDNKGGFYVEVFFGVGYSCRRDTNGKPLADEYALSKDANADTIIISCGKGVGYLKSNWEKYYFEEKSNCNKGHVALWSYKGLNLTETANIELNPDIELPGKTFEIVTENRKKLEELSKTSNTDSLSIASNTKYFASHRYQLPDGREYQFPVDSNDVVELEDEDGTLRKIYGRGPHPFQKQMNTLFDLTASLWQIFEKIELRNRSISFIFSNEFLG